MSCESDEKMLHEVEQEWYAMQGFKTDIKCHFYYDESNNCRKFWVRPNKNNWEKEFNVNPYEDFVEVDGKILKRQDDKIYVLLNKPIGYVTTVKDQFKRDTVMDLLKDIKTRIVPVGRLDMYTSGALILSNDGDFVNKITHPSHEVEKTYNVTVRGKITKDEMKKLEEGVDIGDYITKPAKTKILKIDESKNISRFQIIIHEGKNRQVRRMCKTINKPVLALHRSAIGKINVKNLKLGEYRLLTNKEIEELTK